MDYQGILSEINTELDSMLFGGHVADYIPELSKVSPSKFGVCLVTVNGEMVGIGDYCEPFSLQSVTKVFSLTLALSLVGDSLWRRVGVEPSGDPFNSLVQLEYENGIPRNPFINAGALVISDILMEHLPNPKADFLRFARHISGSMGITYNARVAESERRYGFRNAALVNMMKSYGNIRHEAGEVLDFYFHQCALEMTCEELARTFLLYARHGVLPDGERILSISKTKRLNAIMQTCGFYDESGDFSFRVGLPGKSGVGGGIAAIHPGEYSVAVWSPKLNPKGNSAKGTHFLELLTTKTGRSIF